MTIFLARQPCYMRSHFPQAIEDATQTNLVNLRRTIYLTIMRWVVYMRLLAV